MPVDPGYQPLPSRYILAGTVTDLFAEQVIVQANSLIDELESGGVGYAPVPGWPIFANANSNSAAAHLLRIAGIDPTALDYAGNPVGFYADLNASRFNLKGSTERFVEIKKALGQECFPAGTSVLTSTGEVPIESITPGQMVLGPDPAVLGGFGPLVESRVVRLLPSVTQEWLEVTAKPVAGGAEQAFTVTPGHHYLNELRQFEEIHSIIARGGQIVTWDGKLCEATAERVVYGADTAHLFEETEIVRYTTQGGLACEPYVERGWKTYNFEVEGIHTYVAAGMRVHNESAWSFVKPGDGIPVSWEDTNGDGRDDVVVLVTDTRATRIMFADNGDHSTAIRQITTQENDQFGSDEYYVYTEKVDIGADGVPLGPVQHLFGRGVGEAAAKALTPFLSQAIIGDDASVFEQIATETVIDTITGNIGEFIGLSLHHSILAKTGAGEVSVLNNVFDDFGTDFGVNLAQNSVSVRRTASCLKSSVNVLRSRLPIGSSCCVQRYQTVPPLFTDKPNSPNSRQGLAGGPAKAQSAS